MKGTLDENGTLASRHSHVNRAINGHLHTINGRENIVVMHDPRVKEIYITNAS